MNIYLPFWIEEYYAYLNVRMLIGAATTACSIPIAYVLAMPLLLVQVDKAKLLEAQSLFTETRFHIHQYFQFKHKLPPEYSIQLFLEQRVQSMNASAKYIKGASFESDILTFELVDPRTGQDYRVVWRAIEREGTLDWSCISQEGQAADESNDRSRVLRRILCQNEVNTFYE